MISFEKKERASYVLFISRAQLFEGILALNPGLNLTWASFSFVQIIFSVVFNPQTYTHIHTEQLLETSGADVLSLGKKKHKKSQKGGGGLPPSPFVCPRVKGIQSSTC